MDSTEKPFTAVEWCAGYAGIHLGLKRAIPNLRIIAFSEIEAFACANLVAKMEAGLLDPAPIWPNLKTFPSAAFANKVDLLVAGYPCQPFSGAGKRQGTEDERHLWPYIADGIRAMRPRFCFFENVEGHITLGLSTVVSDLAEMGYKTTWGVFSANEVGAPHQRKRVFILGYREYDGSSPVTQLRSNEAHGDKRWSQKPSETGESERTTRPIDVSSVCGSQFGSELANNSGERSQGMRQCCRQEGRQESAGYLGGSCDVWPSRPCQEQHEWEPPRVVGNTRSTKLQGGEREELCGSWEGLADAAGGKMRERQTESKMGRDANGSADRVGDAELYESCDNRVDELRLLGNGVVPATAHRAWEVLYARLMGDTSSV